MLVANEMKIIITTIISRVIAIITCPHVHHITPHIQPLKNPIIIPFFFLCTHTLADASHHQQTRSVV